MVSNASEDLPEPLKPVITTSLSRGIFNVRSLRLCSRAPPIPIISLRTLPNSRIRQSSNLPVLPCSSKEEVHCRKGAGAPTPACSVRQRSRGRRARAPVYGDRDKGSLFGALLAHPRFDPPFQDIQRERAIIEDLVMKLAHIELITQGFSRLGAEVFEFKLPDFVGGGLAGHHDIAIDLNLDVVWRLAGVGEEIIDGLLAGPAHGVNAR